MPIALLAALLFSSAAEPLAARPGVPQYTLHYDAGTETFTVRLCLPNAAAQVHFFADEEAPRYHRCAVARERRRSDARR